MQVPAQFTFYPEPPEGQDSGTCTPAEPEQAAEKEETTGDVEGTEVKTRAAKMKTK